MTEDLEMQQSREVNVNWLRINVPSIGAIIVAAVTITVYINRLENRLDVIEASRQARSITSDRNFDQIQTQLSPLSNLPYRVDILERGLLATNQRMDTYLQTLGGKIDGVSDRVNGLATKVEVLSQKIDALAPEKRADIDRTMR